MMLTFVFVSVILMYKGGARTQPSGDGIMAVLTICLTLLACIRTGGKFGGCFNPAVGLTLGVNQVVHLGNENSVMSHYIYAFIIGPLLGGAAAGGFTFLHRHHFDPVAKGEKAQ